MFNLFKKHEQEIVIEEKKKEVHPLREMKENLKALVVTIKKANHCWVPERQEFRHLHIVYCLLRGKTREQIEQPKRTFPNERKIEKLMKEWQPKVEAFNAEAIRHRQA